MNVFLEMMVEVGMDVEEQFAVLKQEMLSDEAQKRRDILISNLKKTGNPKELSK